MVTHKDQASLDEYVGGFFDADGYVKVSVREETLGVHPRPTISLGQLAGFFDGDGCIRVDVREDGGYSVNHQMVTNVKCSQLNDNDVLGLIQSYLSDQGIQSNIYRKTGEQNELQIAKLQHAEAFLRLIRDYTIVKRGQIDIMVEEIIPRLRRGENKNKRGFLRTMAWVDKMNEMKGGKRGKYNVGYFEDEWGMELSDDHRPQME